MIKRRLFWLLQIACIASASLTMVVAVTAKRVDDTISIQVSTDKTSYLLGEPIEARFQITNRTGRTVVMDRPSVERGNIRISVINQDNRSEEYYGPGWAVSGNGLPSTVELGLGSEANAAATVFYRRSNADYSEDDRDAPPDHLAFRSPGSYQLVASYFDSSVGRWMLSEPVRISFAQPTGLDTTVWDLIRTESAFAYFLHTAEIHYDLSPDQADDLTRRLQATVDDYPTSVLTECLRRQLTR